MRQFKALVLLAFAASLAGCTVPTTYSKSVSVKKDPTGNVLEVVETETVVQTGGHGYPIRFEYLKDIQPAQSNQSGSDLPRKFK